MTGTIEADSFRSELYKIETRSSDPSNPSQGERWLRTDLQDLSANKYGEFRWFDGASINAVNVVATGSTRSSVEEVLRVQTPNGIGVIPTVTPPGDAHYASQRFRHAGADYGLGATSLPDGEISRWEFEDNGDTTTAIDSVGSNDGSINGATYTSDAKKGSYALSFDGGSDYVDLGGPGPLEGIGAFSIVGWVTTRNSSVSGDKRIYANDSNNVVQFVRTTDGSSREPDRIALRISTDGSWSGFITSTSEVSANTWFHVAGTWDGADGATEVYFNGTKEKSVTTQTGSLNEPNDTAFIGINNAGGDPDGNEWNGRMDNLRLYDKALTDQEVSNLYNS